MYNKYKKLKEDAGVTDYRVSMETGVPRSTFSDWKSGRSKPKMGKLQKIAAYFDVPLEYFLQE